MEVQRALLQHVLAEGKMRPAWGTMMLEASTEGGT
jgi:hypothetical protein